MAYDIVPQSTGAPTSPAEVAIWIKGTANSIMYTVPVGKIFKGTIHAYDTSTSNNYTYTPSGGSAISGTFNHTSTGFHGQWNIYMNAGDTLAPRSSHYFTLVGIETTVNTVSWDTSS